MNDYERIAKIIRWVDEEYAEQPDYKGLAARLGLSEFHFHRLFSRWAGITPKAFLRCLTLQHAKEMLRAGASVLDTSLDLGLSGPSRLHDLCVQLDAASPGELKSGGRGWTLRYGMAESPFGQVLLAEGPRGLCHLSFVDEKEGALESLLQNDWPEALLVRDDSYVVVIANQVFDLNPSSQESRPLKAFVRGTPMQLKVWRALIQIPAGSLTTYGALAEAAGYPKAARATGSAVGANPLAYLIPCHRVIRSTGVIGGYHWGENRKRAMIARETASREGWRIK